ncbi:MAG: ABC transporter permease subunit, partial [Planctomycetota bacterium]
SGGAPRSVDKPAYRIEDIHGAADFISGFPGVDADRLGLYGARWGDFLSRAPGEAPGTGGVFPVILGTVVLTLLLTVSVVPLGVVAALYMREYAKQGLLTSIVRIAINNLAGVPSIVYGMFGLGFFCYFLGGWIDGGPGTAAVSRASWWWIVAGVALCVGVAGAIAALGGKKRATVVGLLWAGAAGLAAWAVFATPYFGGFFPEKLPEQPTFGGRGILWAALTLALLTLPVVIVATEEAVAAVPGSMREGSLGCGATKWQTIRRVVLPSALPGVMTGAILAMARGAGEVAPLMLVGAVNLAPAPPISFEPPFLHGDRTFMHLGFHIYSVGFQSPDVEATEPLVWTITLLLVLVVVLLNIGAVYIRARLRSKFGGSAV